MDESLLFLNPMNKIVARIFFVVCLLSVTQFNLFGQDKLYNVGLPGINYSASDILIDDNNNRILCMVRAVVYDSNVCEVTKFDENSYHLWTVGIGHLNAANLAEISSYPDGSILVTIPQDSWLNNSSTFTRIDPNGQVLWQKKIAPNGGSTYTLYDNGDLFISARNGASTYLMKVNMNGDLIWQKKIDGASLAGPRDVIKTMDGNLLFTLISNLPGTDFVKIDTSGQVLWAKGFNADPITYDSYHKVYESNNGELITLNSMGLSTNNTSGLIVRKFDNNFNHLMSTGFDAQFNDYPYDIVQDEFDNIYVTALTKPVQTCGGNAMFIKMNPNLDTTWVKVYGLPQGSGFGFFRFRKKNHELYTAGWGSTSSQFSTGDAHFIKSDFSLNLDCFLYTIDLNVIPPPIPSTYSISYSTSPYSSAEWTDFSFVSQGNVQIMDACTGEILGAEELVSYVPDRELVMVTDLMGRAVEVKANTLLIYVYSDGTTEKVFNME